MLNFTQVLIYNVHVGLQHPNKINSSMLLPKNKNNIKLQKSLLRLVYTLNNIAYLKVLCFRILVPVQYFSHTAAGINQFLCVIRVTVYVLTIPLVLVTITSKHGTLVHAVTASENT